CRGDRGIGHGRLPGSVRRRLSRHCARVTRRFYRTYSASAREGRAVRSRLEVVGKAPQRPLLPLPLAHADLTPEKLDENEVEDFACLSPSGKDESDVEGEVQR